MFLIPYHVYIREIYEPSMFISSSSRFIIIIDTSDMLIQWFFFVVALCGVLIPEGVALKTPKTDFRHVLNILRNMEFRPVIFGILRKDETGHCGSKLLVSFSPYTFDHLNHAGSYVNVKLFTPTDNSNNCVCVTAPKYAGNPIFEPFLSLLTGHHLVQFLQAQASWTIHTGALHVSGLLKDKDDDDYRPSRPFLDRAVVRFRGVQAWSIRVWWADLTLASTSWTSEFEFYLWELQGHMEFGECVGQIAFIVLSSLILWTDS